METRNCIEVDKLLRLKSQPTDLFYPALPTYKEELEGETEDEARNREQRNERIVDFENECKVIERKRALVDRIPWDETDVSKASFIYHLEQMLEELITRKIRTRKYKNASHTN